MKTYRYFKAIVAIAMLSILFIGCNSKEGDVIEELNVNRVFAPVDLTARIRNMTVIELNWVVLPDAEHYVVEFAEGTDFRSVLRTVEVSPEDLPLLEQFAGEVLYSARVKGVADGKQDSKWVSISIETEPEQIFLPNLDGDILATEATLRWPEGSEVTRLLINPGNINRQLTTEEIASGVATITGLTGETEYTVLLYNNNALRGTAVFNTLIDIGDATLVQPEDDLSLVIADAAPGDVLVLAPGVYEAFVGDIIVDKSITIQGLLPFDKPILNVSFTMAAGLQDFQLIDLEFVGTDIPTFLNMSNAGNYNSLLISGCNIHDYGRQLIYSNTSGAILANFKVDNTIVSNFIAGGGDFIDFRNGDVHNVEITNSTFIDAPNGRDFIRMDGAGDTNGIGITATILIDRCTFVGVSNTDDRIVYVRFANNDITISNNLFANTDAKYSNQTSTDEEITFISNNYFNAPIFFDSSQIRYDTSSNYTILDPGFVDAANGNYTVSNQALIDDLIGDPRWLP